jgi:hypothetical protein
MGHPTAMKRGMLDHLQENEVEPLCTKNTSILKRSKLTYVSPSWLLIYTEIWVVKQQVMVMLSTSPYMLEYNEDAVHIA